VRPTGLYGYPRFSRADFGGFRFLGPGLGNLLFPWARCRVACRDFGLTPIAPTWPQVKIGPFLRGERDKRTYAGLFRRGNGQIGGVRKLLLLATARRFAEDTLSGDAARLRDARGIVEFEGMNGLFEGFVRDHGYLREELRAITRPEFLEAADALRGRIAIHVRLSDFRAGNAAEARDGASAVRLPMDWYAAALAAVRAAAGESAEAFVFTDGTGTELEDLLRTPNVRRVTTGSSVGDLLALAGSGLLIASGSTFSMWASFLGRMPVVWFPGQRRQDLYYDHPELEIEWEEGAPLPEAFRNEAARRRAIPC